MNVGPRLAEESDVLAARVLAHAESQPDCVAFRFLGRTATRSSNLTWAGLVAQARGIARHLEDGKLAGKPVAILCPNAAEFVPALVACLLSEAIAVPTPPVSSRRSAGRIASIMRAAQPQALLAGREVMNLPWIDELVSDRDLRILRLEDTREETSTATLDISHSPAGAALMQFTSGSTGEPAGVLLSGANLAANCTAIARAYGLDRSTVGLSWLPLHHDMGLVGHVLTPLWLGCRSCIMDPLVFLQRPLTWLKHIGEEKATITSAPNFAYELCSKAAEGAEHSDLDLSSLATMVCGGEPVLWSTLERFADHFRRFGLKWSAIAPSYGLAEATLLVASGKTPAGPKQQSAVDFANHPGTPIGTWTSLGAPVSGVKIRIVEPGSGREVGDGSFGEIEVSGTSVGKPVSGGDGTVLTGDFGFMVDGSLVVTGRRKELIILKGQNVFPADVEAAAMEASALVVPGGTAAIGCDEEGSEKLIVVAEIRKPVSREETIVRIRRLISERVALATGHAPREVVPVEFGSLPRTSSGKVQRGIVRELYLAGRLRPFAELTQTAAGERHVP